MLELSNINKVYNEGTLYESSLFDNFNLNIKKHDFVSVIGSNGSGKTSMLNIICGSTDINSGQISIGGRNITTHRDFIRYKKIGRVYQDPAMGTCPDMTVLENMSLADNKGKSFNLGTGTSKKRIGYYKESLAQLNLNLEDKLNNNVGELSGGQRQAIALLISTMTPIDFLILDEHTAALDPKTAEVIMDLTDKIVHDKKITTIMVTHNLKYAIDYGNRIIMMHQGDIILDKCNEDKMGMSEEGLLKLLGSKS